MLTTTKELKECAASRNLQRGREIHKTVAATGDPSNVYVASALISMYAKCGSMQEARIVFEKVRQPNLVCWNALILGYAENGEGYVSLELFSRMVHQGQEADARTFMAALKACIHISDGKSGTRRGKELHLMATRSGCESDAKVEGTMVDMYTKLGNMQEACRCFDNLKHPDVVSWTAFIMGYAQNGECNTALDLFSRMRDEGCASNARTFVASIKACTDLSVNGLERLEIGRKLHLLASSSGWDSDMYVQSCLIDMYAKCGNMRYARRVFDSMKHPDVVIWTALILGYADNGESEESLEVFSQMGRQGCAPNSRTFVASLKAIADLAGNEERTKKLVYKERGKKLHCLALKGAFDADIYVQVCLVDMYSKCGSVDYAHKVFDAIAHPTVVCWNALILGYVANGEGKNAVELFSRMKDEGFAPDAYTFSAVLKACEILAALDLGKALHGEINESNLSGNPFLATCLIDFYAKCGSLNEAELMFDLQNTTDMVTWNALMAGYSCHGDTRGVFSILDKMLAAGLKPNGAAVSCILTACSHAGLVDQGNHYFQVMTTKYGFQPEIEHFSTIIDLYSRSNKLHDAMVTLRSMPIIPNVVIWTTILAACRKWENVKLGRLAFESLMVLDGHGVGSYVQMANIVT